MSGAARAPPASPLRPVTAGASTRASPLHGEGALRARALARLVLDRLDDVAQGVVVHRARATGAEDAEDDARRRMRAGARHEAGRAVERFLVAKVGERRAVARTLRASLDQLVGVRARTEERLDALRLPPVAGAHTAEADLACQRGLRLAQARARASRPPALPVALPEDTLFHVHGAHVRWTRDVELAYRRFRATRFSRAAAGQSTAAAAAAARAAMAGFLDSQLFALVALDSDAVLDEAEAGAAPAPSERSSAPLSSARGAAGAREGAEGRGGGAEAGARVPDAARSFGAYLGLGHAAVAVAEGGGDGGWRSEEEKSDEHFAAERARAAAAAAHAEAAREQEAEREELREMARTAGGASASEGEWGRDEDAYVDATVAAYEKTADAALAARAAFVTSVVRAQRSHVATSSRAFAEAEVVSWKRERAAVEVRRTAVWWATREVRAWDACELLGLMRRSQRPERFAREQISWLSESRRELARARFGAPPDLLAREVLRSLRACATSSPPAPPPRESLTEQLLCILCSLRASADRDLRALAASLQATWVGGEQPGAAGPSSQAGGTEAAAQLAASADPHTGLAWVRRPRGSSGTLSHVLCALVPMDRTRAAELRWSHFARPAWDGAVAIRDRHRSAAAAAAGGTAGAAGGELEAYRTATRRSDLARALRLSRAYVRKVAETSATSATSGTAVGGGGAREQTLAEEESRHATALQRVFRGYAGRLAAHARRVLWDAATTGLLWNAAVRSLAFRNVLLSVSSSSVPSPAALDTPVRIQVIPPAVALLAADAGPSLLPWGAGLPPPLWDALDAGTVPAWMVQPVVAPQFALPLAPALRVDDALRSPLVATVEAFATLARDLRAVADATPAAARRPVDARAILADLAGDDGLVRYESLRAWTRAQLAHASGAVSDAVLLVRAARALLRKENAAFQLLWATRRALLRAGDVALAHAARHLLAHLQRPHSSSQNAQ